MRRTILSAVALACTAVLAGTAPAFADDPTPAPSAPATATPSPTTAPSEAPTPSVSVPVARAVCRTTATGHVVSEWLSAAASALAASYRPSGIRGFT